MQPLQTPTVDELLKDLTPEEISALQRNLANNRQQRSENLRFQILNDEAVAAEFAEAAAELAKGPLTRKRTRTVRVLLQEMTKRYKKAEAQAFSIPAA